MIGYKDEDILTLGYDHVEIDLGYIENDDKYFITVTTINTGYCEMLEEITVEKRYLVERALLDVMEKYENYKKHGHYWVGDCETSGALALRCDDESDPLEFLGKIKIRENGYVIVCIDKKTNKLYIP